jgi:hypothetical protein
MEGHHLMATRTTVYLDETLLSRAQRFVPPRGLSQWINDLVSERLSELERVELEALMREGYIAREQESQDIHTDWQIVDGEGWPS